MLVVSRPRSWPGVITQLRGAHRNRPRGAEGEDVRQGGREEGRPQQCEDARERARSLSKGYQPDACVEGHDELGDDADGESARCAPIFHRAPIGYPPSPLLHNASPPSTAVPSPFVAAQVKMTGHMQKSAQVMAQMNKLVKVQDVQQTMQEMQKEMMRVRGDRAPWLWRPPFLTWSRSFQGLAHVRGVSGGATPGGGGRARRGSRRSDTTLRRPRRSEREPRWSRDVVQGGRAR